MFRKPRIEFLTIKEFNEHLKYCIKYRQIYVNKPVMKLELNAYINVKEVFIELTYKREVACTYKTRLDGQESTQEITGVEAFRTLQKYCKTPKMDVNFSASSLLWKNDKYDGTRNKAICYDMNSAYANAMSQPMPNVWQYKPRAKNVGKNEIGFDENGNRVKSGYAPFVFPLIESPYKKFVNHWFEIKRTAQTKEEKNKAKNYMCYSVGYLQRINPFIRAQVIGIANEIVRNLIDEETTLYCNTDSIVSLVPLNLKLGDGLGEWKIEHEGLFAYKGFNYQWNYDIPSYRHKSKNWFDKGWDILKDPLPVERNKYVFDYAKLQIRRRETIEKEK